MKKKSLLFLSLLLCGHFCLACSAVEDAANSDDDDDDAQVADTAATGALDTTGDAYLASVDDAEAAAAALIQALSVSDAIDTRVKAVSFSGNESGNAGTVSWTGTVGETDSLNLDYTITFDDYQASAGDVTVDGDFSISVSEGTTDCSGAWNIADLDVVSDQNAVILDSTGAGLTLSGTNCENMSIDGTLEISGDVVADCSIDGTVNSPSVDCS